MSLTASDRSSCCRNTYGVFTASLAVVAPSSPRLISSRPFFGMITPAEGRGDAVAPPLGGDAPPGGEPGAAAKAGRDAGGETRCDAPEVVPPPRGAAPVRADGPIALVRYPRLRGMRRERLRREAEEARQ